MASEINKFRSRYSKSFLEDGKITQEISSFPIHYQDDNGEWKDIDRNIKNLRQWEFTSGNLNNTFSSYFGDYTDDVNRHLFGLQYKIDKNLHWINFKLKDGHNQTQKIQKDKIIFTEALDGVDLEYIVSENYLKENIILNKKTDIQQFDFTIKTNGLELVEDEDGYFKVVKDDVLIWFIDKPYMFDSVGNISYGIKYTLTKNENDFDVFSVIIEDSKFLDTDNYPIVIDPTLVVQEDNTGVTMSERKQFPNEAYTGNSGTMEAALPSSRAYFVSGRFALYYSELNNYKNNENLVINKAILSLYCYNSVGNGLIDVSSLTSPLTSAQQIDISSRPNSFVTIASSSNNWVDVDFTNEIRTRKQNFYGLKFTLAGFDQTGARGGSFYSPFYSDQTLRPKLIIQYLLRPTLGFHSGNPDLDGYYSDSAGNNFRYLNYGQLIAGQTSTAQRVYLRNLTDFSVSNLRVNVDPSQFAPGMKVELSLTNSPFIAEEILIFNGTTDPNQDRSFYVRVVSTEEATYGSSFNIYAKANPVY